MLAHNIRRKMMMMGGNNQFTAQNECGGSLGSNWMNNCGVGIEREHEIRLKKGPWNILAHNIQSKMMMMGGNNQFTTQNEGGGFLGSNGMDNGGVDIGREGEIVLEKGLWTVAEYVRSHGEGNWNVVQKNTGLTHRGKSCRLRWVNHLLFVKDTLF
ncbi:hypothetical protein PVK06_041258 [Gossypium arboreum]|uniref:Uncharacterized protein n=1 Tax=Gossypium arboreum TaxID=29729 RepID=A0ABR0N7P9_GOSAR|nr:hypothetical protein PVK06_041258 [Gossypium arboreum]